MTEEKEMVERLIQWHEDHVERFRENAVTTELRKSDIPDLNKAGVNFEPAYVVASITIWGWGDFEVIVMCKRTKETILADDLEISSPHELSNALNRYYD